MSFKLGKKVLIVNDPAQAQLLFYARLASGVERLVETDDDFQTTTPFDDLAASPDTQSGAEGAGFLPADVATDETIAQADFLRILGFGDFTGAEITEVIGVKGVFGAKQVSTLTFAGAGYAAALGKEVIVDIDFTSDNLEGEFATDLSNYKRRRSFALTIRVGETATTLATRLVNELQSIVDSGAIPWITASNVAGVITFTSAKATISFRAAVSGTAIVSGEVTGAFATTTAPYPGRNTYEQLKGLRLESVNGAYVESFQASQVPSKTARYSSYLIKKSFTRPDLGGVSTINQNIAGSTEFEIFLNETTCSAYITSLTKWLNANVARRIMYTATTAAGVLAPETATLATTVDATEPFTTPLV